MKLSTLLAILTISLFLLSCNQTRKEVLSITTPGSETIASDATEAKNGVENTVQKVGCEIYGDFNGDGVLEYAYVELFKKGSGGNPIDGGVADGYAVKFSHDSTLTINIGCCEATLVNEGDLNGDGSDEFSIFQAPMNGCTYRWRTITYAKSEWNDLFDPFIIPGIGCGAIITAKELEDIVTLEDKIIYYKSIDPNEENAYIHDENGERIDFEKLLKEKATIINR